MQYFNLTRTTIIQSAEQLKFYRSFISSFPSYGLAFNYLYKYENPIIVHSYTTFDIRTGIKNTCCWYKCYPLYLKNNFSKILNIKFL